MKNNNFVLLIISVLFPFVLFSQGEKLSIKDASYMNRSLFPSSVRGLKWMGSTNYFTFNEGDDIMASKATSYKPEHLLGLEDINSSLQKIDQDTNYHLDSGQGIHV